MWNSMKSVFSYEVTCIPKLINKHMFSYDNVVWNGLTWIFLGWVFIHYNFQWFLNKLLIRLKQPTYVRVRVHRGFWSLGFYSCCIPFCFATLIQNGAHILKNSKTYTLLQSGDVPEFFVPGFLFVASFIIHTAFWDVANDQCACIVLDTLFLSVFAVTSYILSWVELFFALMIVVGVNKISLEVTRLVFLLYQHNDNVVMKYFTNVLFFVHFTSSIVSHVVVVPFHFLIPAAKSFMWNRVLILGILNVALWAWLAINMINSPLIRMIYHYSWHTPETVNECPGLMVECVLFDVRNDSSFNLSLVIKEVVKRRERLKAATLSNKRASLAQTVNFAMRLKRKIRRRREEKQCSCQQNDKDELISEFEDEDDIEDSEKREKDD